MDQRIYGIETEFGCMVRDPSAGTPEEVVEKVKDYAFYDRKLGVIDLHARYILQLKDEALVYVENSGFRHGAADSVYFCTAARFECAAGPHDWLTRHIIVAQGVRRPAQVELDFFLLSRTPTV